MFGNILDHRSKRPTIPLADALLSGFAMFSLKDSSLLAFDKRRKSNDPNLKSIFNIAHVPYDTQIRTILDDADSADSADSADIVPLFNDIFHKLQRRKVLEPMVFMNQSYLLSIGGTDHFSSRQSTPENRE